MECRLLGLDEQKLEAYYNELDQESRNEGADFDGLFINYELNDREMYWLLNTAICKMNLIVMEAIVMVLTRSQLDHMFNAADSTLIYTALQKNFIDAVNLILDFSDNTNRVNSEGLSHFFIACQTGHVEKLQNYIGLCGVDVNQTCPVSRLTPLHTAVLHKRAEAVELLLQLEANPNTVEIGSLANPLHVICSSDLDLEEDEWNDNRSYASDLRIIQLLVEANCDVDARNAAGNTPLLCLFANQVSAYCSDMEGYTIRRCRQKDAMELLLDHGADVSIRNSLGLTILHVLINSHVFNNRYHFVDESFYEDKVGVPMAELLISYGADVNDDYDESIDSPLQLAVSLFNYKMVKLLLSHNASVQDIVFEGGLFEDEYSAVPNLYVTQNFQGIFRLLKRHGLLMTREHYLRALYVVAWFEFWTEWDTLNSYLCTTIMELCSISKIWPLWEMLIYDELGQYHNDHTLYNLLSIYDYTTIVLYGEMYMSDFMRFACNYARETVRSTLMEVIEFPELDLEGLSREIDLSTQIMINDVVPLYNVCVTNPLAMYPYLKNGKYKKIVCVSKFQQQFHITGGVMQGYITKSIIAGFVQELGAELLLHILPRRLSKRSRLQIAAYLDLIEVLYIAQAVDFSQEPLEDEELISDDESSSSVDSHSFDKTISNEGSPINLPSSSESASSEETTSVDPPSPMDITIDMDIDPEVDIISMDSYEEMSGQE
ncbi:hypothetical protein TKK_0008174 [Trichogramma kaykai]